MYESDPEFVLAAIRQIPELSEELQLEIRVVCKELLQLRVEADPQIGDTAQIVEPYARQVGKVIALWKNSKQMRVKFVGYELEARRFLDGWFITDTLGHKTKTKLLLGWTE